MNIYLSKKFEKFLGIKTVVESASNERLGNWNADLFKVCGKNCILFMNDKNCYAILMSAVKKSQLKNLDLLFREQLIAQLYDSFEINELEEIVLRRELTDIRFCKSNNNKKIIGTLNHHKQLLSDRLPKFVVPSQDIFCTGHLNDNLLGTKIDVPLDHTGYFVPNDLMFKQIKLLVKK